MIRNSLYARDADRPRSFAVPLVGGQHYQEAIRTCRVAERVFVRREPDNRYDERALKVQTLRGQCIGYVAKDSWLHRAIHDRGEEVTATILRLIANHRGITNVVLAVAPRDDHERSELSSPRQAPTPDGTIMQLLVFG